MFVSFGWSIIGNHSILRTFKAHTFLASCALNFKTSSYSNNRSSARPIGTDPPSDLVHVLFEHSIRPVAIFFAAHPWMVSSFARQAVPFFAFSASKPIVFNHINLRTWGSVTKSILAWAGINKMIDWHFYYFLPVIFCAEAIQIAHKYLFEALRTFNWIQRKVLQRDSDCWLQTVEAEFMSTRLEFKRMGKFFTA